MENLLDPIQNIEHYKRPNGRIPGWQIAQGQGMDLRQEAIAALVHPLSRVTDLGCADGTMLIMLYRAGKLASGDGVDLWQDGIAWGQRYCAENGLPIKLTQGTIEDYIGRFSDVAIIGEVLEHSPDPVDILHNAAFIADRLIVTVPIARPPMTAEEEARLRIEPDEHVQTYSLQTLEWQARQAGMSIVSSREIGASWRHLVVELE